MKGGAYPAHFAATQVLQLARNLNPKRAVRFSGLPFFISAYLYLMQGPAVIQQGFLMFEYSNPDSVQRKSPLARIAGLLLGRAILLRILSSVANTEKAFWAYLLAWSVLHVIEDLSLRKAKKSPTAESKMTELVRKKPELSGWWKTFGALAAFTFVTIFLGLWPLGGCGALVWLINWFSYDFIESSRFGKRGLTTLSLR